LIRRELKKVKLKLEIRKAKLNDIPKIKKLINSIVPPYKSEQYLTWWQFGSEIPTITCCACYEDEIVGMFMIYKRKLNNGLNCGVLMGLAIKDKWRGKGIFQELGDHTLRYFNDIDVFCCLPGKYGKNALVKNFNFQVISGIKTMVFNNNADYYDQKKTTCTKIVPTTRLKNLKLSNQKPIMFLADQVFREWRYVKHPRYSFNLIQNISNEFVITKTYFDEEQGLKYGDIEDFELQEMKENRLINLISSACSCLRKDADIVTIQAIPDSLIHKVARKIGFVESSTEHYFCLKVANGRNEYLYQSSDWLIKWGDYMR
jgi:hypothetical protein